MPKEHTLGGEETVLDANVERKQKKTKRTKEISCEAKVEADPNTDDVGRLVDGSVPKKKKKKLPTLDDAHEEVPEDTKVKKKVRKAPEVANDATEAQEDAPVKKRKKIHHADGDDVAAADEQPAEMEQLGDDEVAETDRRVHAGNLPFGWDEARLREYFEEKCGGVAEVALLKNPLGASRGIAFVRFGRKREFKLALQLDGDICNGRPIKVSKAMSEGERPKTGSIKPAVLAKNSKGGKARENEVFVGGLPYVITEEAVRKLFEACGYISFFQLPINKRGKRDGTSKGIAFVAFSMKSGMQNALKLHGSDFNGRNLVVERRDKSTASAGDVPVNAKAQRVKKTIGKSEDVVDEECVSAVDGDIWKQEGEAKGKGKGKSKGKVDGATRSREFEIFVGGLAFDSDEEQVRKDFEDFGEVLRFAMPKDEEGNSRGIAFINYATKEGIDKALTFHETEYAGKWIRVLRADAPRSTNARRSEEQWGKGSSAKGSEGAASAASQGCIVAATGKKQTFDSDDE